LYLTLRGKPPNVTKNQFLEAVGISSRLILVFLTVSKNSVISKDDWKHS